MGNGALHGVWSTQWGRVSDSMGAPRICGVTLLVLPPGDLLEQSSRRRRAPIPTLNVDVEHFSWGHLRLKAGINKLCSSVRPCWLLSLSKAGGALPHFLRLHPCNSSPISSSGPSLWSGSLWQVPFRLAQGLGKSNQPWKAKVSLGERREKLLPPRSRRLSGGGLLSVPQLCYDLHPIPITSLSPSPFHLQHIRVLSHPIPILIPPPHHPHPLPVPPPCPTVHCAPPVPIGLEDIQSKFICNERGWIWCCYHLTQCCRAKAHPRTPLVWG